MREGQQVELKASKGTQTARYTRGKIIGRHNRGSSYEMQYVVQWESYPFGRYKSTQDGVPGTAQQNVKEFSDSNRGFYTSDRLTVPSDFPNAVQLQNHVEDGYVTEIVDLGAEILIESLELFFQDIIRGQEGIDEPEIFLLPGSDGLRVDFSDAAAVWRSEFPAVIDPDKYKFRIPAGTPVYYRYAESDKHSWEPGFAKGEFGVQVEYLSRYTLQMDTHHPYQMIPRSYSQYMWGAIYDNNIVEEKFP